MNVDVGDNGVLDLETITRLTSTEFALMKTDFNILSNYNVEYHSAVFLLTGDYSIEPFRYTAETKSYTAKAEADAQFVTFGGEPHELGSGKFVFVLMRPGDSTRSEGKLREKKGITEFYIPIATVYNNVWIPQTTCLEAVTLRKGIELEYATLCTPEPAFKQVLKNSSRVHGGDRHYSGLDIRKTYDTRRDSFGNPHAIEFKESLAPASYDNLFQIGAFLEFTRYGSSDLERFEKTVEGISRKIHLH